MKEKIVEKPTGCIARLFGKKPKKEYMYSFDSINEFLTSQHKTGIYILGNLEIVRKTEERRGGRGSSLYHLLLKDNTGQIRVRVYPESVNISPLRGPPIMRRNYFHKTWSEIMATREGDIVNIACEDYSEEVYALKDLSNNTLAEKTNQQNQA
jgi:hypothetical protein